MSLVLSSLALRERREITDNPVMRKVLKRIAENHPSYTVWYGGRQREREREASEEEAVFLFQARPQNVTTTCSLSTQTLLHIHIVAILRVEIWATLADSHLQGSCRKTHISKNFGQ
jgi:hypothetical protein